MDKTGLFQYLALRWAFAWFWKEDVKWICQDFKWWVDLQRPNQLSGRAVAEKGWPTTPREIKTGLNTEQGMSLNEPIDSWITLVANKRGLRSRSVCQVISLMVPYAGMHPLIFNCFCLLEPCCRLLSCSRSFSLAFLFSFTNFIWQQLVRSNSLWPVITTVLVRRGFDF